MMRNLRDLRAERLGITLPGKRTVDPFPDVTVEGGFELEELFRLTRPDKKRPPMLRKMPTAGEPLPPPPVKHAAPVAMQKAMARYPRKVAP